MSGNGNNDNKLRERRKYRRVEAGDNILAVLKPTMKRLGLIRDISKSGLSLKYISARPFCENINKLDIFSYPLEFSIEDVPCTAVHERLLENLSTEGLSRFKICLCGFKFKKLLPIQKEKLSHLISHCAEMSLQR